MHEVTYEQYVKEIEKYTINAIKSDIDSDQLHKLLMSYMIAEEFVLQEGIDKFRYYIDEESNSAFYVLKENERLEPKYGFSVKLI